MAWKNVKTGHVLVKKIHANSNVELSLIVRDSLVATLLAINANVRNFYANLRRSLSVKKSRNVGVRGFVVKPSPANVVMTFVQSHGGIMEKIKITTAEMMRIVR